MVQIKRLIRIFLDKPGLVSKDTDRMFEKILENNTSTTKYIRSKTYYLARSMGILKLHTSK